jgi:SAM-dependent methyltransferase
MNDQISTQLILDYVAKAPVALALERSVESTLFSSIKFVEPVLDIGCGDGIFAALTFKNRITYGLDPNKRELICAKNSNAYENLICAYGNEIPLKDNSVGTVFSNSVLEHIKDLGPVFEEIYRVLKPGGLFVFTIPSERFDSYSNLNIVLEKLSLGFIAKKYRNFYNYFWRHYNFMSKDDWIKWVNSYGFNLIHAFSYNPKFNCRLNDALAVLGLTAKINKIFFNRWTFFSAFRSLYLRPFVKILQPFLRNATCDVEGGLVFISVAKPLE